MKPTLFILAGIVGFVSVFSLKADTVILRNGTSLNGKIIGQTRDIVRFQNEQGVQTINKINIRRIIFGKEETPEEAAKRQEEARRQAEEQRKAQEAYLKRLEEAKESEEQEEPDETSETSDYADEVSTGTSGSDALWRSLVLPGWGQHRQGRAETGNAYAAAFAGSAIGTLLAYGIFEQNRLLYEKSAQNLYFSVVVLGAGEPAYDPKLKLQSLIFGLQYLQVIDRNSTRNSALRAGAVLRATAGITAAIYLANVVDVVVFAPDRDTAVHLFANESGAGLRVQTTW